MAMTIRERLELQRTIKTDIAALKEGGIGIRERLALQRKVQTDIASLKGESSTSIAGIEGSVPINIPVIDSETINEYNRSTFIGGGRDVNAELKAEGVSILDHLKSKKHVLDTDDQKKKSSELIESYLEKKADFFKWEAAFSASNPSWFVTGRSGRNTAKYNAKNEKHMDEYSKRVDRLESIKRNIYDRLYSMRPDQVKNDQFINEEINNITRLAGYIASELSEGKKSLAADTRKWASPKAFKAINKIVEIDRSKTIKSLALINDAESVKDAGGLVGVFGARSNAGKLIKQLLSDDSGDKITESALSEKIDAAANQAATSNENDLPEPTLAQYESGLYKKGHIRLNGLDIAIENPRGSTRSGVDPDGKKWSSTMTDHYGYVKRSMGADGDHVDVYIGPDVESDKVFIIDQIDQQDDSFDEHKCMMGYKSKDQAIKAYKGNFDDGWKVGEAFEIPVSEFKDWVFSGDTKRPFKDSKDLIKESVFY